MSSTLWMKGTPRSLRTIGARSKKNLMLLKDQQSYSILSVSSRTWPSRRTIRKHIKSSAACMNLKRRRESNTTTRVTNKSSLLRRNWCRNKPMKWQLIRNALSWEWTRGWRSGKLSTTAFCRGIRMSKKRLRTSRIWKGARKSVLITSGLQLHLRVWWQAPQRWEHRVWNSRRWARPDSQVESLPNIESRIRTFFFINSTQMPLYAHP